MQLGIDCHDLPEGARVIAVSGEVDVSTSQQLADVITAAVGETTGTVIVDLDQVTLVDSSGLGALVTGSERLRACDRSMTLRNLQPIVRSAIDITGLADILTVDD